MLLSRIVPRLQKGISCARFQSTSTSSSSAKEFKVVLDGETLYVDQSLAEALGWNPSRPKSVSLTLSGWAPHYFAICRSNSDSGMLQVISSLLVP